MNSARTVLVGLAALLALHGATLAQDCAWRPWAAHWGNINEGPDLFPPNGIHNPTNWDYTFSQPTVLNTPQDTPTGGGDYALHWFLDAQPPETQSNGSGSGGVYQEITVTPGEPMQYSFWWKAAHDTNTAWFEFMLINAPFSPEAADMYPAGNIMRKAESENFGWEFIDDQSPLHMGPDGPTITPTGDIVTVVLKAGRSPAGAMEAFFDNVEVWQAGGANLIVNGDFEDTAQQPPCDNEHMFQDPDEHNYWLALTECPGEQHTTSPPVDPISNYNTSDTTMTIPGTYLEFVTGAELMPADGGDNLVADGITVGPGPNETEMEAVFPTTGATDGYYHVVTVQAPSPPCLTRVLPGAFQLICPNPASFSGLSPASLTDPTGEVQFTISGTNLDALTAVSLEYSVGDPPEFVVEGAQLIMIGNDLRAKFNLTCVPAGSYRLVGTRDDGCRPTTRDDSFLLIKTPPPQACVWRPWAAGWSVLNTGPDLEPPNRIFDPTNWDHSFSQQTVLNTPKDTPPGGGEYALHWFLDSPPPGPSNAAGSGGVYQEISVSAGTPLEYSYYWKGTAGQGDNWFEVLLIDGPFSLGLADLFQEDSSNNNPAMIRKKELSGTSFGWQEVTDQTPADMGPAGPRPQTITPTGTIVTVVLKAGRGSSGGMESFWDNIVVRQGGGDNLITNGGFENYNQRRLGDEESMFEDPCEFDYWRWYASPLFCPDPFADADEDGDVDHDDFGALQVCYTGSGIGPVREGCECFDRPEPTDPDGDIDQMDLGAFENCASGPGIQADITCDGDN